MKKELHAIGSLPKAKTGIDGFDELTFGGLPQGRVSLISGGAGSGKTLFSMEFLVRGALEFNEPGVFISFEESEEDLASNFGSLGFDLKKLQAQKKVILDYVHIERSEIEETGEYDLEGLFVRLGLDIDSIGAKRVVLDTLEALFAGFTNQFILRSEIRRLFRWLKQRGITALVTAESGQENFLTRHGLEEYVSDCVIMLDHRVTEQISTRRLRVVKYRGSTHGTNEYPFLLDEGGISVLPITSVGLDYAVSNERVSTGIPRLDTMLSGKGYYLGSSVLISGTAGTGKTSFAAQFVDHACAMGEKCIYFAFEESSSQIMRNMKSIGMNLTSWVKKGRLLFQASRPTAFGLEMHLAHLFKVMARFKPGIVVVDPLSNMTAVGSPEEVKVALMRLVDMLKSKGITSVFTSLVREGSGSEDERVGVSSLMDTWMLLREVESGGETNRLLSIIKSRGMAHSNQLREYLITGKGIEIVDVYTGPEGVLTGTARLSQQAFAQAEQIRMGQEIERKKREVAVKRMVIQTRIKELHAQMDIEQDELQKSLHEYDLKKKTIDEVRQQVAQMRGADDQGVKIKRKKK